MSLDNELTADVSDELFWDPKVDNTAIAVSADDGKITLRGTVGSLREKIQRAIGHFENVRIDEVQMRTPIHLQLGRQRLAVQLNNQPGASP